MPVGTAFQRSVWLALADIGYGQAINYGELARPGRGAQGLPEPSARPTGANPIAITILPCHRALAAKRPPGPGYGGGLDVKRTLLATSRGALRRLIGDVAEDADRATWHTQPMENAATVQAAFDLTGRVAVVTGAGSGIGQATAEVLAGAGATVVCADLDPANAAATARAICAATGRTAAASPAEVDVADRAQVHAAGGAGTGRDHGRLDVMANIAGDHGRAPARSWTWVTPTSTTSWT